MGVPKFYRWTSERYPCLSEVVREYQIPEFDNLYLDMNGIIHLCSHPNDDDPHFRISEEKIFKDIFHYIETLFKMIKPKKVFFMAVDGVAPRAKMNQQRGRRFRSAREADQAEKKAIERGEILPQEERFDSNCITPGTVFMAKLHEQLKYFVTMKVSQDQMWQDVQIYLSGHETPGEGEHKIMEFIRYEKTKPDYDPNTRHCLYGLDADLMMLGLCSHEIHFSLLREEVQFCGRKAQKRTPTPEETTFHLLHLSLMRDYINHEFSSLKGKLEFEYNIEKIIDDWILMGFLVGNDFIPHLPHMHIAHDALPMLYKAYIEILPSLDGYINENGYLNLSRFEKYLKQVSQFDYEKFNDTYADLRWFESKSGNSNSVSNNEVKHKFKKNKKNNDNIFDILSNIDDDEFHDESSNDLSGIDKQMSFLNLDSSLDEDEDDDDKIDNLFELEFQQHKRDYYINKLEYPNVTTEVLKDQTKCYVHAIQWNLHYYYHGVCSWSWYYPHHYAPYISDVKDFADLTITFDMGTPFLPFEQLLAVLPSASKKLLPAAYQDLMSEKNSPLIDYYPVDFKTDLNGKQQDWEAVVLIPFINEKRLLEAMKPLEDKLTFEEKNRNKHGPCLLYTYIKERQPFYASSLPGILPDIHFNNARCLEISSDEFAVERFTLKNSSTNRVSDVYFPGFPSLRYIEHTAILKKAEVKVFQMVSHKDSMILQITPNENNYNLKKIAEEYIGKCIQVGWPHFSEAKVVAVADDTCKFSLIDSEEDKINVQDLHEEKFNERGQDIWFKECEAVRQYYYGRLGIDIGYTQILVYATPLIGRRFISTSSGKLTLEKQWTLNPLKYAFQTTVKTLLIHDSLPKPTENIRDMFSAQLVCFILVNPYYGCMGKIVDVINKRKTKLLVELTILKEPDMEIIYKNQHTLSLNYMKGYTIAQKLGISSLLLSRITGTFYILSGSREAPSQVNIGLNLKFNKRNKEVPGYTKKTDEGWLYSSNSLHLLTEYIEMFPELFEYIGHHTDDSTVHINDIFCNGDGEEKIKEIQNWLKSHPYSKIQHQQCGTDIIDEPVVKLIEEAVNKVKSTNQKEKALRRLVSPQNLYVPSHVIGSFIPDPITTYKLLDRVIVVRDGYSVPIGFRGTIIGIHNAEKDLDSMYDIVFDEEFLGGLTLRCSPNRGYRLPCFALINLTHGYREEHYSVKSVQKPTAVVHPQASLSNSNSLLESTISHSKKNNNIQNSLKSLSSKKIRIPLNKINHSPNSPFVSQQVISNIKDHNKKSPRNVTDHSSYHNQESSQIHDKGDNEFFLLWKALQEKSIDPRCNYPTQTMNKESSELNNAAKSLQSQSFVENQQNWKKNKKNFNTSMSNLEFPHRDQNSTNQSAVGIDSRSRIEYPSSQKANINQTVEHPSSDHDFEKVGKTVLSRLLQIDDETNENVNNSSQKGAKTKGKVPNVTKESKDTNLVSHPFQQLELNHSYQQPKSHYYPATWKLLKLVQNLFRGAVPIYSYMTSGPNQRIIAEVKLPDDSCFYGYGCCTKVEAGESAALFALNEVKKNYPIPFMGNYNMHQMLTPGVSVRPQFPPPFSSGPSNAFVPNNVPSMLRHPPPQAWLQQQSAGNAWLHSFSNASIDQNHALQLASYNQDFYINSYDSHDYYETLQNIPQSPNKSNQGTSSSQRNFAYDPHLIPMQVTKRSKQYNKMHSVPGYTETAVKHEQISSTNDKKFLSSSRKSVNTKNESSSKQSGLAEGHKKFKKKSRLAITFDNDLQ